MKKTIMLLAATGVFAIAGNFEDGLAAYNNKNYTQAVKLFQLLADQGDATAQSNLGFMYENGQGVKQDYVKAAKLYRLAADQGDALAQYNLGLMYAKGQGVRQNMSTAKELFGKACDNGSNGGCKNYAILNKR